MAKQLCLYYPQLIVTIPVCAVIGIVAEPKWLFFPQYNDIIGISNFNAQPVTIIQHQCMQPLIIAPDNRLLQMIVVKRDNHLFGLMVENMKLDFDIGVDYTEILSTIEMEKSHGSK